MSSPEYVYHRLLRLIEDGEIALISIPCYPTSNERVKMWIRNHSHVLNSLSALSIGNTAFHSVCANVSRIDWVAIVQKNVDDDIVAVQRHPAILYKHRRFIVVKGVKDHVVTPTSVCDLVDVCRCLCWKHSFRLRLRPPASLISRMTTSNRKIRLSIVVIFPVLRALLPSFFPQRLLVMSGKFDYIEWLKLSVRRESWVQSHVMLNFHYEDLE